MHVSPDLYPATGRITVNRKIGVVKVAIFCREFYFMGHLVFEMNEIQKYILFDENTSVNWVT